MGGTTAKGCVIQNGNIDKASSFESARVHRFKKGSGIPLRIPVIDIMEIGAGGGSIASVDELGLIQVGPRSAGAAPGPACYARGGQEPTVSDADLVLGYLDAEHFLGGEMPLDLNAARSAIETRIARPLGLSAAAAAWGIHEIVTENMAAAIRIHMAEKGVDPSRFTVVAFGGAGPVHAYALARRLGTSRILIPPGAGIASAFGLLVSPVSFDLVKTHRVPLSELEPEAIDAVFASMQAEANSFVRRADAAGAISYARSLDVCYIGQGHTVNVPLPADETLPDKARIRALFEKVYEATYGRRYSDMDVELINLRLVAQSPAPASSLPTIQSTGAAEAALKGQRSAYSGRSNAYVEHAVYDRYRLHAGASVNGPAIIEERESTTIVDCGGRVRVDDHGTLIIDVQEA
jgi:N-methylhydantoinase A/oxoprolinase/acetone carboxylase beta subunit